MIYSSIFNTVEFYVILSVIAASVVALMAVPQHKGEVKTHLIAGELVVADTNASAQEDVRPSIAFECHEGNLVVLRRYGLRDISADGALSLVVKVSGFDVVIEERVTAGNGPGEAVSANFRLEFFAPEWYHIRYESEHYSLHAALTLHVREGIVMRKDLIH